MTELSRLQGAFQAYIRERDPAMLEHVVSTPGASAQQRLEIYAQAYRLRLLETLATDFPGLHTLLGDAQFEQLGRDYIDAHPSRHPSIRWFGEGLEAFLSEHSPYREQPALAELARFEWAQGEAFDGAEAATVDIEALAAIAPERWSDLKVELHPALQLLELRWNVAVVWQSLDAGEQPPALSAAPAPVTWLMWRQALQPHWRSLSDEEVWALRQALAGATFGAVCEGLQRWLTAEEIPLRAAGFIKQWVSDGLVVAIAA